MAWASTAAGPLLEKYGKYVLIKKHEMELADRWFARYGNKAVFIARLLPIIRTFISLPAGIARMNFGKFAVYSFVGSLPWCFALAYVGVMLGNNWNLLEQLLDIHRVLRHGSCTGQVTRGLHMGYKDIH